MAIRRSAFHTESAMVILRAWLLCALLAITACTKQPEPIQIEQDGAPALWQVTGPKGTAWIFGSVHLLPPDIDWQTPVMDRAIRQSDQLVLETSGLDDEQSIARIFANMGVSGGNPPIARRVAPALHPILDELDAHIAGPRKTLDHMESWAAALTLAGAMSADMGLSQGMGVESMLTLRFRSDSKPVSGLETITEQFGFFDTLSEGDQRIMLNTVLRGKKDNRAQYEKLLTAWMKGDVDAVLQGSNDSILASPTIRKALLDDRNQVWASKIATMLNQNQSPFVAVGAAHVAGPVGVPALLANKGYRVERIQ